MLHGLYAVCAIRAVRGVLDSVTFLRIPGSLGTTTIYTVSDSQAALLGRFEKVSEFQCRFRSNSVTFWSNSGGFWPATLEPGRLILRNCWFSECQNQQPGINGISHSCLGIGHSCLKSSHFLEKLMEFH